MLLASSLICRRGWTRALRGSGLRALIGRSTTASGLAGGFDRWGLVVSMRLLPKGKGEAESASLRGASLEGPLALRSERPQPHKGILKRGGQDRALSLLLGWRTPTAYDVWGDLEERFAASLSRSSGP